MKKKIFINGFFLALLILLVASITICGSGDTNHSNRELIFVTWNVRGYPEKTQSRENWFSDQLTKLNPDVICIQEIANQERVEYFLSNEPGFSKVAFLDTQDGQDNAIFTTTSVNIDDISDPNGFQHLAQAAYVSYKGFDAVIVTVHLSWTDEQMREQEKVLLKDVVSEMLKIDPDVIIAGDFNTKEQGIQELADSIGMEVMVPLSQNGVGTTHAGNRYDHFLISTDLANEEAVKCRIETFAGNDLNIAKKVSDHLPVVARFKTDEQFKDRQ